MSRKRKEANEKDINDINIEFEFMGTLDIDSFFKKKALEIIEKINKL